METYRGINSILQQSGITDEMLNVLTPYQVNWFFGEIGYTFGCDSTIDLEEYCRDILKRKKTGRITGEIGRLYKRAYNKYPSARTQNYPVLSVPGTMSDFIERLFKEFFDDAF